MSIEPAFGAPSRSAVRRGGDNYQDLIAWCAALRVIQRDSDVTRLELEINGAGNVDDVVLRRPNGGDNFGQVKWATTTASTIDEAFMTAHTSNGKSLLQKFFASYEQLRNPSRPPVLELLTNRSLDPAHPLLGHVDGRSDLLVPFAADAPRGSAAGKALEAWAAHIGATREQLLEMLAHLAFRPGLTLTSETDRARLLMAAAGLRQEDDALQQGLNAVAEWVRGGRRVVTADEVRRIIDDLGMRVTEPRAVLLVQAIDRDPHPEDAVEVLDWVDLYAGDSPSVRIQPKDAADWATMAAEFRAAAHRLEAGGSRDILVRGAMRQATFLLVGASLPAVRGFVLSYAQGGQVWATSDTPALNVSVPIRRETAVGAGGDLAIAIGVAVDPTDAVVAYVKSAGLPVDAVITLSPADGSHDQVVTGSGEAVSYARLLRGAARAELEKRPDAERLHLFLAGPGGLALLLGHRWNRLRPTFVYEHLGVGKGYARAFTVDA